MSYADTRPAVLPPQIIAPIHNMDQYPRMHYSPTPPTWTPKSGDLWFNSTDFNHHLYIYDSGWKEVQHRSVKMTVAENAPTTPVHGDMWFHTTTKQLSIYSLFRWELVAP